MTIESHAVRFQIGAIVMPHEVKTPQDYRAAMVQKLGKMPSMAEFAAMENKTVSQARHQGNRTEPMTEAEAKRIASLRGYAKRKTREILARIFACMATPKTAAEIEAEIGLSRQVIGSHLRAAYDRGEVVRTLSKRVSTWSLA